MRRGWWPPGAGLEARLISHAAAGMRQFLHMLGVYAARESRRASKPQVAGHDERPVSLALAQDDVHEPLSRRFVPGAWRSRLGVPGQAKARGSANTSFDRRAGALDAGREAGGPVVLDP
jgi:hypothetical protein